MLNLVIESSCDETSAAVVRDGTTVLSNAVASQIPIHQRYGGVVPELASRNHIRDIHKVIDEALTTAGHTLNDMDGFAATAGPGLVGSLIVGVETARTLAMMFNKPFVGLNHLEGHLTAVLIEDSAYPQPTFPYLGIIVSGGHTDLYHVIAVGDYELLGRTRDDAAGEAFDKVAKMLGLSYPGGIEIDKLAKKGNPEAIEFPRPMWTRKNLDFSFSGLKTAVLNYTKKNPEYNLEDVCASFQEAVVDILIMKTITAAKSKRVDDIVFSGGVSCNSRLRELAKLRCEKAGFRALFAPLDLCTDNAAMLGPIAEHYLKSAPAGFENVPTNAQSNMSLGKSFRESSGSESKHR